MALVIPTAGGYKLLGVMLGKDAFSALSLRLYSNDYTPKLASVFADFTEVSGSGYAGITLTAANWVLGTGLPIYGKYPQQTFTFTAYFGNVYGYFITDASNNVVWAERFSHAPLVVTTNGDTIKVTPEIELR